LLRTPLSGGGGYNRRRRPWSADRPGDRGGRPHGELSGQGQPADL